MKIYTYQKQIVADHLTPVAAFRELRDHFSNASLFESSDYSDRSKSKSFIGLEPFISIKVENGKVTLKEENKTIFEKQLSSLLEIEELLKGFDYTNLDCQSLNGFFGVVGYDAIPLAETIKFKKKTRFEDLPVVFLALYKFVVVFDNFKNEVKILQNSKCEIEPDFSPITSRLQSIFANHSKFNLIGKPTSNLADNEYIDLVLKAKQNIKQGDVFQLVLSRAFSQEFQGDEFEAYRSLRSLNPSPYMFYFDLEKAKLFGASPEAHLVIANTEAEIHPIAGTFKKTGVSEKDELLKAALLADEKENAEHNMLVDLARNDLNYSCKNVRVVKFKTIQEFSHVIHMVSKVKGDLKANNRMDTFSKTFPAGTLSGAPKYKAMELINAYEPDNRGYYGGVIGQFAANGDLNVAIVIRSALSHKGRLHYQAGAGIVKDSNPESELQEIFNKTGSITRALSQANQEI